MNSIKCLSPTLVLMLSSGTSIPIKGVGGGVGVELGSWRMERSYVLARNSLVY